MRRTDTPDAIDRPLPGCLCTSCGGKPLTAATAIRSRCPARVFDLPEPKPLIVTEHRAHGCRCTACGSTDASALSRTGSLRRCNTAKRIGAFVLYLLHYQLLPEKRLAMLMADLFWGAIWWRRPSRGSADDCCRALRRFRRCLGAIWSRRRWSSTWMKPASGLAARRSGFTSPQLSGSPSTASRPNAAACWRTLPALSFMTTGSRTTRLIRRADTRCATRIICGNSRRWSRSRRKTGRGGCSGCCAAPAMR